MTRHRAFALYLLVIAFVFVAFVLGLMIGTGSVEPGEERPSAAPFQPAETLDETELDFYEELSKPILTSRNPPSLRIETHCPSICDRCTALGI